MRPVAFVGAAETALVTGLPTARTLRWHCLFSCCLVFGVLSPYEELAAADLQLSCASPRLFTLVAGDRAVANEAGPLVSRSLNSRVTINAEQLGGVLPL